MPEFYKWVVEIKVHKSWVADGFDLDNERASEMVRKDLQYANEFEVKAKVLKKPDAKLIRKEQGYED